MIYYDRVDISEGIDVNKTSASKECDVCRYWYFLTYSLKFQPNVCNRSFKFQPNTCNGCHDLLIMSVNLNDTNIKGSVCCSVISLISKNEAINLLQNADLTEKSGAL